MLLQDGGGLCISSGGRLSERRVPLLVVGWVEQLQGCHCLGRILGETV